MAKLTASDVTVTVNRNELDVVPAGPKLVSMASITFGDGTATYPGATDGGVPLPDIDQFGFKRRIQMAMIQQASGAAATYEHRYVEAESDDPNSHKIQIRIAGTEATTGIAPAEVTLKMLLIGE